MTDLSISSSTAEMPVWRPRLVPFGGAIFVSSLMWWAIIAAAGSLLA